MKLMVECVFVCAVLLTSQVGLAAEGPFESNETRELLHSIGVFVGVFVIVGGFVYKQWLRRKRFMKQQGEHHDA
jgi:hypothetical protein